MASDSDRRGAWIIGACVIVLSVVGYQVWGRWPPPQLKTDEQVFTTVDALFTALTARDSTRLADCERRLQAYHAEGRISDAVADRLGAIIEDARDGNWEPAAHALYDFISGQHGGA